MSKPDDVKVEYDGRTDGPIHEWFGLTYSNYMILHRTLLQCMPIDWQKRFIALIEEMDEAYRHFDRGSQQYWVRATEGRRFVEEKIPHYRRGWVQPMKDGKPI